MAYKSNHFVSRALSWASVGLCYSIGAAASHLEIDDPALADHCELELGWQMPRSDHQHQHQFSGTTTCRQAQWEWHLGLENVRAEGTSEHHRRENQAEVGIKLPINLSEHLQQADWKSAIALNLNKNLDVSDEYGTEVFGILGKTLGESNIGLYTNLGLTHNFNASTQLLVGIAAVYDLNDNNRLITEVYQKELGNSAYQFAYQHNLIHQNLQLELSVGNAIHGNALQIGADMTFYFGH